MPADPTESAPALAASGATSVGEATAFLYSGANPVQRDVSAGAIKEQRAAVVRGRVRTRAGAGLAGVRVRVVDHPELGFTLTRDDGAYDMAVNGGGAIVLSFTKDSYLPVQRRPVPSTRDYEPLDDVVMIQQDTRVTDVDLGSSAPYSMARSSVVTDEDGSRRASLLFEHGTTAKVTKADGTSAPVSDVKVRMTEFTVGETGEQAMPAGLPSSSGYTYAANFEVTPASGSLPADGSLSFSQPAIAYVDDFVGFPTGTPVPSGRLDPDTGLWVPQPDGVVIKIVGEAGGLAQIDTDGDGAADNGSALTGGADSSAGLRDAAPAPPITNAERAGLAESHEPGDTLLRNPINEPGKFDFNAPIGRPTGSDFPHLMPDYDKPKSEAECHTPGSIIGCTEQTLGEAVGVSGTSELLHYTSDRTPGFDPNTTMRIPLSEATLPGPVKRIDLTVAIAGKLTRRSFPPDPDQSTTFTWDGKDAYGRAVQGTYPATVRVAYVYDGVYRAYTRDTPVKRFAEFGEKDLGVPSRTELTTEQTWVQPLGHFDARGAGIGGWTLTDHHAYDPVSKTLYLGDGTKREAAATAIPQQLEVLAGTGTQATTGDGGAATDAGLEQPSGMDIGPDGSIYVADPNAHRVRKISPDGRISTVVGGGQPSDHLGDGGPATEAELTGFSSDVAVAADGSIYVTDHQRIRKVTPDGIIHTVAGNGQAGEYADGQRATEAPVVASEIEVTPDGTLYFRNSCGSPWAGPHANDVRIAKLTPAGEVTTVVGKLDRDGTGPFDGGIGPLMETHPIATAFTVADDGTVYYDDQFAIRRVDHDGIVTTVMGDGDTPGIPQAGESATGARIGNINALALDHSGRLYFSTYGGDNGVFRISANDTIERLAGRKEQAGSRQRPITGDIAATATLDTHALLVDPSSGDLIVSDGSWKTVYRLKSGLPGFTLGDIRIPSADGSEIYVFDHNGRHLRTEDPLTGLTTLAFVYDSAGRLASISDRFGNQTRVEHTADGAPTAVVPPQGPKTTLSTTGDGYLARITNPAGDSVQVDYAADGLLDEFTDPRGHTKRYEYTPTGRLARAIGPVTTKTLTRTDTSGETTSTVTTTGGRTTTYRMERSPADALRRTVRGPDGTSRESEQSADGTSSLSDSTGMRREQRDAADPRFGTLARYASSSRATTPGGKTLEAHSEVSATGGDPADPFSFDRLTQTTDINGRTTASDYQRGTGTATTRSPEGRTATTHVSAHGLVDRTQSATLAPLTYGYDGRGRLTAISRAGRTSNQTYDADGNLASITDPLGRTATLAYDAASRITSARGPDLQTTSFGRDRSGNLTSVTPPGRPAHTLTYDEANRPTSYSPPDRSPDENPTRYSYDEDGALASVRLADDSTMDLDYDAAGRLIKVIDPGHERRIDYDSTTGQVTSMAVKDGERIVLHYDGTVPTDAVFTGPVPGSTSRTYDSDLRVASTSVNGAHTIDYQYDRDDLLTRVGDLDITRNPGTGLPTSTTLGSVSTSNEFDDLGQITSTTTALGGTDLYRAEFTYRADSSIDSVHRVIDGGTEDATYSYNQAGRLTGVAHPGQPPTAYTYDANGNRTSFTRGGEPTVTATYDDQDRLLTQGKYQYAYSATGTLRTRTDTTTGEHRTLDYDANGLLNQVSLEDGTTISYDHDALGRRILRRVNGTITNRYLYGEAAGPSAELDADGNVTTRYVYGTSSYVPDYMVRAGRTYHFIRDERDSPILIANASTGEVVQQLRYDEFGRVLEDTNPGFQPFGYAGGLYEARAGLVRFGSRDYDPEIGRWTAKDPLGFAAGDTNLYAYVSSDPINSVDPSGLYECWLDAIAGFGDGLSLGLTYWARELAVGGNENIDFCSTCYQNQAVSGQIYGLALSAGVGLVAARVGRALVGGEFVIGRYAAGYIQYAQSTGAAYFSLGGLYNFLPGVRTGLNYGYLGIAALSGRPIVQVGAAAAGSALEWEIGVLASWGARVSHVVLRPR